jgi:hypothetical protein
MFVQSLVQFSEPGGPSKSFVLQIRHALEALVFFVLLNHPTKHHVDPLTYDGLYFALQVLTLSVSFPFIRQQCGVVQFRFDIFFGLFRCVECVGMNLTNHFCDCKCEKKKKNIFGAELPDYQRQHFVMEQGLFTVLVASLSLC